MFTPTVAQFVGVKDLSRVVKDHTTAHEIGVNGNTEHVKLRE